MHFTMFDDPAILLITEIIVNELCSPCVCVYIYIYKYIYETWKVEPVVMHKTERA